MTNAIRPPGADEPGALPTDAIPVRSLGGEDSDAVARLDALVSGRSRKEYFRHSIERSRREGGVSLSLAAELDDLIVGFLIASVDYGEFGVMEPVATLDAIGVHPDFRHRHVARALLRQLALNLRTLRIERVRTEVDWRQGDLLGFLGKSGFQAAPRLCLEAPVDAIPTE
jgi:ribosomal protein S18 acetylase RimI-like enzyme